MIIVVIVMKWSLNMVNSRCASFEETCDEIEENIVKENLEENGGTLKRTNLTYRADIIIFAALKGRKIGFASIYLDKYPDGLYISQIAVKKEYQHLGVGKSLVDACKRLAALNKKDLVCDILDTNVKSQGLFKKAGFSKVEGDQSSTHSHYKVDLSFSGDTGRKGR